MIRLIIFDWDDVFSQGAKEGYIACYYQTFHDVDIPTSEEQLLEKIMPLWGNNHHRTFEVLLKDQPEKIEEASKIYEQHLFSETFLSHLRPIPGVSELVKRLAENYALCVATGANRKLLVEHMMPQLGIPDVFTQIVTGYDITGPGKPDSHMVDVILEKQSVPASEAALVGDHENDILMARNAGVTPIAVLTGHLTREAAEELEVEYIFEDVTQIEEAIGKILN